MRRQKIKLTERLGSMDFPPPADPEFRRRVFRELQAADDFVRDTYALPRRHLAQAGIEHRKPAGPRNGHCVACGCLLDERTVGCRNCAARHDMRLHGKLNRICEMIERAFT